MKTLKTCRLIGLTAAVLCSFAAFQARAVQPNFFTLNFDENGNATYTTTDGGSGTIAGQMVADPTQAGHPLVLTYMLPVVAGDTVISGDIRILDDPARTILSDVISFTDEAGDLNGIAEADRMIFYSADHTGALADTGIPGTLFPTDGGIGAIENANGSFTWAPGAPLVNNVYNGLSDVPVPEPTTVIAGALLLLPFGASTLRMLRRNRVA